MEKKIAPSMKVLSYNLTTNMKNIVKNVGEIPQEIFKIAVNNGLHPSGAQFWIYKWENGTPAMDTEFNLSICLPVATFGKPFTHSIYKLIHLDTFNHVSQNHYGAWDKLKDTYAALITYMQKENLHPGNSCREIYLNSDFENPENNITEVQFGLH